MGSSGEPQQAMTRERQADIRRRAHARLPLQNDEGVPLDSLHLGQTMLNWITAAMVDRFDLLAEVERQRAEMDVRESRWERAERERVRIVRDEQRWRLVLTDRVERLTADNERLRARETALASHVNEALTDIAQSVLESGGLPPEQFPLDHARVTVVSVEKRLKQARALLASADAGDLSQP